MNSDTRRESPTRPDFSVVICAYTEDRWDNLVAAVESVQRQSVLPREIVVVIDHNPKLLERARTYLSGPVVIENSEQRGLSGARNSGVAVAKGAVLAFLDDDAVAAPAWLERLRNCYTDANIVGVGGAIEPLWWGGKRPAWFPEEFDWVVGCTYRGTPQATALVRNLIGANMSFRREVFTAIGGFRNVIGRIGAVPVGCEETELCIRMHQHWPHKALIFNPAARVAHYVPASRACWNYFRSRCYAEGRSKALVSQLVGTRDALASERTYTLHTLPTGILREIGDVYLRRDLAGLARAGAIVAGLAITTVGYARGHLFAEKSGWWLSPTQAGIAQKETL